MNDLFFKRHVLTMGVAATLLAACGSPPPLSGIRQSQSAKQYASESAYCLTSPCLYVTNAYHPASVDIYGVNQRGRAKPIARIRGASTGLISAEAIAVDQQHNVYVANVNDYYVSVITVYRAGEYGDIAPAQTITGPHTKMGIATGVAADSAGNIYVTNFFGRTPCVDTVTVYAAGATGDAAPIAEIKGRKTGLCDPNGIAVDSSGTVYVTIGYQPESAVNIYGAGATGNVAPTAVLSGSQTGIYGPAGIAVDAEGNIYVSDAGGGTLLKFRSGATGNVKPALAIYGIRTKLKSNYGIAVDPTEKIYTNNETERNIVVFAKRANGDVPPIRMIRPRGKDLSRPTNIAIR